MQNRSFYDKLERQNGFEKKMTEDKEQIYILDARGLPVRIGLVVLLLSALVFGWFAVRWQLGNLLADITSPNEPNAVRTAEFAKTLAPSDPLTNWLTASITKETDPEHTAGFETVVRLAPNDYRWWIQLGRAYEQAQRPKEAEMAFKRAVEMAPNYTFPHWQLGNFYLRQERPTEAFRELQTAAENNSIYREQVFSIAWDYFERDSAKLESIVGNSPDVRAGLAKFYAAREFPQKSLEMWNTLSPPQKQKHEEVARIIVQALYDKRFLLSSVEFVNQLGIEKGAQAETVYNGGFEENISNADNIYFGWKVIPTEKMRVTLNSSKKYEGRRSLEVTFTGFDKLEVNNIYQTIAVKPNVQYALSFWLKTENLKSAGPPKLEVLSATDNQILASSEPFPVGANDWQQFKLNFTVPDKTEGVYLRTSRAYCGEKCPIFGTFWYDGFKLENVSGEK
jgi:tetratricopeptide (TPR) repeat protein